MEIPTAIAGGIYLFNCGSEDAKLEGNSVNFNCNVKDSRDNKRLTIDETFKDDPKPFVKADSPYEVETKLEQINDYEWKLGLRNLSEEVSLETALAESRFMLQAHLKDSYEVVNINAKFYTKKEESEVKPEVPAVCEDISFEIKFLHDSTDFAEEYKNLINEAQNKDASDTLCLNEIDIKEAEQASDVREKFKSANTMYKSLRFQPHENGDHTFRIISEGYAALQILRKTEDGMLGRVGKRRAFSK